MPACIAHYQFGQEVLNRLAEDLRSFALACKQEFDSGLQGPDIFFFYKPYRHTKIRDYGTERHNEPAVQMFAPILEKVREKAALSYLIGLICHYALDKCCHPYVYGHSYASNDQRRSYDHQLMESAFDRYIMLTSGLPKARYLYLPAAGLDYEAMASLWPGIDANIIRKCVKAERRAIQLLDHRKLLETCETMMRRPGGLTPMTLPDSVPEAQTAHVRNLRILYEKALNECSQLIRTALTSMGTELTSGLGFDLNYKGNAVNASVT